MCRFIFFFTKHYSPENTVDSTKQKRSFPNWRLSISIRFPNRLANVFITRHWHSPDCRLVTLALPTLRMNEQESVFCHHIFTHAVFLLKDFVHGLSILSRGSLDEKLRWTFSLYDINGDGYITREEMTDIVSAIYDLMGKLAEPCVDEDTVKEKVDRIFKVSISST